MDEIEKHLRESLDYFEQILDVLPEDRTALEFLCVACKQLWEEAKFLKYSLALAEVILREKDLEAAANLIENLKDSEDSNVKRAVLKLQVLLAPAPELTFEKPEDRIVSATKEVAAKAELELLNRLVSDGVLTKSLVRSAYDQLESPPTAGDDFLISALAILEKENLNGSADAIAAVADAAHAPPVPLDVFDIPVAQIRQLPEKLVKVRGVIPFVRLANEWAVAVLNPLDEELKREISAELGAKCHFFLALPASVEKVIERVFQDEDENASAAKTIIKPVVKPVVAPMPKVEVAPEVKAEVAPASEPEKSEEVAGEEPPMMSNPIRPKLGVIRKIKK